LILGFSSPLSVTLAWFSMLTDQYTAWHCKPIDNTMSSFHSSQ